MKRGKKPPPPVGLSVQDMIDCVEQSPPWAPNDRSRPGPTILLRPCSAANNRRATYTEWRATRTPWWNKQWPGRQRVVSTSSHVVGVGREGDAARNILLGPEPGRKSLKAGEIFVHSRSGGHSTVYRFSNGKLRVTGVACDDCGSALLLQGGGKELLRIDLD